MPDVRRREVIGLLGGAAAAWPLEVARAQQAAIPVVGFLRSTTAASAAHLVTAFRQGLSETEFVDGQSVAIDYSWADNQNDRLPGLVAEMIRPPGSRDCSRRNSRYKGKTRNPRLHHERES